MIKVHHLNNSRSQRVLWLLEEIGLDYEIVPYRRDPKTLLAPASLKNIHPLGKSPVIDDQGRIMAETGAIVDYLVTRYGPGLAPAPGSELHWRYITWLHYAEGSVMPPLLLKLVLTKMGPLGWPALGFVNRQIALHLDFLESQLAASDWFTSDAFSAADIMLSFALEVGRARGGLGARPRLEDFLQRAQQRPGFRRALDRGGRYDF